MSLCLAATNNANLSYSSLTHYEASDAGILDLDRSAPLSGIWRQVDPMFIFWSMTPEQNSDQRFWSVNVHDGISCNLQLYDGEFLINGNIGPGLWVKPFIYKYKTSTTYPLYETMGHLLLINKWRLWVQSALPTIHLYPQSGYNLYNSFGIVYTCRGRWCSIYPLAWEVSKRLI